jgi:hypothetical protein
MLNMKHYIVVISFEKGDFNNFMATYIDHYLSYQVVFRVYS